MKRDGVVQEHVFVCAECGRRIVRFAGLANDPPLCAACVMFPSWFADEEVRKILDPDHDGREAMERR